MIGCEILQNIFKWNLNRHQMKREIFNLNSSKFSMLTRSTRRKKKAKISLWYGKKWEISPSKTIRLVYHRICSFFLKNKYLLTEIFWCYANSPEKSSSAEPFRLKRFFKEFLCCNSRFRLFCFSRWWNSREKKFFIYCIVQHRPHNIQKR